jgi:hypothetical protein
MQAVNLLGGGWKLALVIPALCNATPVIYIVKYISVFNTPFVA